MSLEKFAIISGNLSRIFPNDVVENYIMLYYAYTPEFILLHDQYLVNLYFYHRYITNLLLTEDTSNNFLFKISTSKQKRRLFRQQYYWDIWHLQIKRLLKKEHFEYIQFRNANNKFFKELKEQEHCHLMYFQS